MKVAKNTFLIHVHGDRNSALDVVGANGEKLTIDTDYNKYKHTVQIGTIYACPVKITDEYTNDTPLSDGDVVLFHHFVCQQDHKMNIGENIYRAEYFHLYAKVLNGEVIPLEDAIFVEPILEDESNMFAGKIQIKTFRENIKQKGIVYASSKRAQEAGVYKGDVVYFSKNADYPMVVNGRDMYRMRIRNICATEKGEKLNSLHNKILVRELYSINKKRNFIDLKTSIHKVGVVEEVGKGVVGIEVGDTICYFNSSVGTIEVNDKTYAFLEQRHIHYKL